MFGWMSVKKKHYTLHFAKRCVKLCAPLRLNGLKRMHIILKW